MKRPDKSPKRPKWKSHKWKAASPVDRKLAAKKQLLNLYDTMPEPNLMKLARDLLARRGVSRSEERYHRLLSNLERKIGRYLKERRDKKA
jgi:hypothetical protein